jgi:sugar phosphate isomerase/epimerase
MRLGGPHFGDCSDPDLWIAELRRQGYSAAYCPVENSADDATVRAYEDAAARADIVIAEVGAWSNPLSPNDAQRRTALAHCAAQLALAERIGARCCVNISGSRGAQWDGPDAANLTDETFDRIVDYVRATIDAVKPTRTYYALETMPWMYPDSPDSYVALLKAVDRERFAVHLDPVNLVCSPQRYWGNAALIRECFEKLGSRIRSCHAKDITLSGQLTVHLDEARPGLGSLDYRTYLRELTKLDKDMPLMLEHLATEQEYVLAADYIRVVAREAEGIVL